MRTVQIDLSDRQNQKATTHIYSGDRDFSFVLTLVLVSAEVGGRV
ncbi:MAG: hypothetical protein VKL59_01895 [Nostocaceae cyanobacterium]|nr:hypothetical protein [Nostocaceae cyanobacterium]